jgi:hypothetical protein
MKNQWRLFGAFCLMVLAGLVFLPKLNQNLLVQNWRSIYGRIDGSTFTSSVTEASSPIVQLYYAKSYAPLKATGEIDETLTTARMQEIVRRYPNDAAALAYYVRSDQRMNRPLDDNGPLSSSNLAWSVTVDNYSSNSAPPPPGVSATSYNFPPDFGKIRRNGFFDTRQEYDATLELIRHGQKLEPQNTYFDWMLILALLQGDRGKEAIQVVEKAWQKTDFDDHTDDEFIAMTNYRRSSGLETEVKYANFAATSLPHL